MKPGSQDTRWGTPGEAGKTLSAQAGRQPTGVNQFDCGFRCYGTGNRNQIAGVARDWVGAQEVTGARSAAAVTAAIRSSPV